MIGIQDRHRVYGQKIPPAGHESESVSEGDLNSSQPGSIEVHSGSLVALLSVESARSRLCSDIPKYPNTQAAVSGLVSHAAHAVLGDTVSVGATAINPRLTVKDSTRFQPARTLRADQARPLRWL